MAAEKLRDLSKLIDVPLLDATIVAFYGTGSKEERTAADHILRDLQSNPDMWLQVVHILSVTHNLNTKFFALQGVIKYRWNALPVEQRDGMKNYISDVIVKLSRDEISFRGDRLYVNKLNIILVQIGHLHCLIYEHVQLLAFLGQCYLFRMWLHCAWLKAISMMFHPAYERCKIELGFENQCPKEHLFPLHCTPFSVYTR